MRSPAPAALLLLGACAINPAGPATPRSPAAEEAAAVGRLAERAEIVRSLAHELTSLVDESRRKVADGRSTPEAEAEQMRALVKRIEDENAALQEELKALEERVHTAAGDPAWPQDPEPKR